MKTTFFDRGSKTTEIQKHQQRTVFNKKIEIEITCNERKDILKKIYNKVRTINRNGRARERERERERIGVK